MTVATGEGPVLPIMVFTIYTFSVTTMSVRPEEILGLVKGLLLAVNSQKRSNKEQNIATQQHLEQLSTAVGEIARNLPSSPATLRLPNLTLPEFIGRESFSFFDQLTQVLKSVGVPPKFWVAYLK